MDGIIATGHFDNIYIRICRLDQDILVGTAFVTNSHANISGFQLRPQTIKADY